MAMLARNVGIIADGGSDIAIFRTLLDRILSANRSTPSQLEFIELRRQTVRDSLDKYWREASRSNQYALPHKPAVNLMNQVSGLLMNAHADFESEVGYLTNRDILVLTTDAERVLNQEKDYLQDWAFHAPKILVAAIEKFYSVKASQSYAAEFLPLIVSLIVFPSAEILIAAAKGVLNRCQDRKPKNLKHFLYGTDEIRQLSEKDLADKALKYLDEQGIQNIFRAVPESRLLIQTLSSYGSGK